MQKKKSKALMLTLAVLACIMMLLYILWLKGRSHAVQPVSEISAANIKKTLEKSVDVKNAALPDSSGYIANPQKKRKHPGAARADTAASSVTRPNNTLSHPSDSIPLADTLSKRCKSDTTPPWVYTDPAGGLHHGKISIKLFGTKPCAVEWKSRGETWNAYAGEAIAIDTTTTLMIRAVDSCGNAMAPREERYEIAPEDSVVYCPDGMEHISVGTTDFCIDRYEWPNKKGALPKAYISLYQAMDTCVTAGKRLCTSDEWTIACTGPYGWKYPYSAEFQLYACVTHDTAARPSGSKSECRGYFGVFDMSGNLAEWTSTKSSKNIQFYNVMGGFWESGPQSGCFDARYSYYPQNRHNPVGFRCCSGASPRPRIPRNGADKP